VTRIKICGCRTAADALAAAAAGADFVGLMFAQNSRRRIGVDDAGEIVRALGVPLGSLEQRDAPALHRLEGDGLRPWFEHGATALDRLLERKRPLTVGVFAGMNIEEVNEIVDEAGIDLIQLSGGEPWAECFLANRQVIKAVHVASSETANDVLGRIQSGSALAVMLDRAKAGAFGGTGERIDWDVAAEVSSGLPVWLAGGLSPENVSDAVAKVAPWCVDVSTGVETDGEKDAQKVKRFIEEARR
jgi:phosphoribosylanthranilate isomerase